MQPTGLDAYIQVRSREFENDAAQSRLGRSVGSANGPAVRRRRTDRVRVVLGNRLVGLGVRLACSAHTIPTTPR